MKLSLSWIKSHIADSSKLPEPDIIYQMLNTKTTEIESALPFTLNCTEYELVQVKKIIEKTAICSSKKESEFHLPMRSDCELGQWYLTKKNPDPSWVTVADLGAHKEGLLPAIIPETFAKKIYHDVILTIDNKAITHRPDLWGHRGLARELAMLFDLSLIPIEALTAESTVIQSSTTKATTAQGFSVIKRSKGCSRIAFCSIECKALASDFNQARLLSCVDVRPINSIVDATNYVMNDIGHPMHAFDQASFPQKNMIIRMAKDNERLTLLDGTTVSLSNQDIIIANDQQPVSLAGILGGKQSGIRKETETILVEAAHFDGNIIRKTSQYHKKRTDASTRFEKELDPHNTVIALQRFLYLIKPLFKGLHHSFNIHVIGKERKPTTIKLDHAVIENMIGTQLERKKIVAVLSRLEYMVKTTRKGYLITVPSFRMTNGPVTRADIVEEIARNHGYNNINPQSISIPSAPYINKRSKITAAIKSFSALGLGLHELNSYAFFDESFIEKLSYKPQQKLTINDPVSENWTTLNSCLTPHLLKAVHDNAFGHEKINFFEVAPTWNFEKERWNEQLTYGAVWYDQSGEQSFYDSKQLVTSLFHLYGITVTWQQLKESFWFEPYQSASLMNEGQIIGQAGMINSEIHSHISKHQKSTLFAVEFSFDWYIQSIKKLTYKPVSCYQRVQRDVSLFINHTISFDTLKNEIIPLSNLIEAIDLIEFLEKEEWSEQRALTIRITYVDQTKTLTKEIIDTATDAVKAKLQSHGAVIR